MKLDKLNQLKFKTKEDWGRVKVALAQMEKDTDRFTDSLTQVMSGVSELAIQDIPLSAQEARNVYHELAAVLSKYEANVVQRLESTEGKGKAVIGHAMELAEDTVGLSERMNQLIKEIMEFERDDVLLKTAVNSLHYIVAADDEATEELLGLIGPARVKDWLDKV